MFRLPFSFIITGMVGFVLFHILSLFSLYEWINVGLRGPSGWFHTHLFILGWATMLAMGAVYQLIHVILQSKIYSETLGFIHYAFFTIGLCGLLYGFWSGKVLMIGGFATVAFIGILLFAWNMAVTLFRAKHWDAITISAACAVLYLVLTGMFGMAMGLNFITGNLASFHERLLGAHIWLGTIGWFGMLITGFSYKMLPMFYLSHHFPIKLQKATLIIWNIGVISGVASFLLGGNVWTKWASLLIITMAITIYNIHLLQIKKHRVKQNPGLGIKWSVYASQALMVFAIGLTLYTLLVPDQLLQSKSVTLAGWIYLGGWVSFTILCYASKIVPFLWWTHKYGPHAGKPGTPLMADLLNEKKVEYGLILVALFIMFIFAGIAYNAGLFIAIGGSAFSLFSILYMILISRVFAH
ncbi:hypothetical protein KHA96_14500 [Bacillus sp. FJAT-49711]|uniref:hypothetical protein n=1 Tax=Bacillus sp. FJAT-49711 TaxID=2833585 RepID=UPI001BC92188|nr:hypothetical protein [Bacillus sp. FJAT-49711]MBS4219524.1 hypothetical protein [Bacillus sp. FJAT-49711]